MESADRCIYRLPHRDNDLPAVVYAKSIAADLRAMCSLTLLHLNSEYTIAYMMLSLPHDVLMSVMYNSRTASIVDLQTLRALPLVCKQFAQLIHKYRERIVEHYTVKSIECNGTACYRFCGKLHRDNDLPAIICADRSQKWYTNGRLHRGNGLPAIICVSGTMYWCINGKRHRGDDLPAVVWSDGTQFWFHYDKQHRDNDLPAVVRASGAQEWWINGKKHRDSDLPAIIWSDGTHEWWIDGERIH